MNDKDRKKPLTEEDIVDRAARRAHRSFLWKVGVLIFIALAFLIWSWTR